ncbi:LysE family translocator [Streptomyces sp. V1I1]|uniref:LysE family translocator n=1 Tax=Streptomyces sp. V1I1 TaxID=3042272 RepID=UPI002780E24D|nr:LysE family translocator [Streptomyces sp. V1I1]MDQ0938728.1 threonine/homoserine/homoserine lactone efflux protein [Streptomyces sp. V1I1]
MTNDAFVSPLLFAVVATITPGGATTLVTASGAHFGFRRSVPLIAGIAIGLATLAAAAAAGLAGLLLAIPSLQLIVTLTGSAYLMRLAWRIGRSGPPSPPTNVPAPTSLIGGMGLLWLNPKGWTMTLGAAASFTAVAGGPFHLAALLGTVFGFAAAVSLTLWCAAGLLLARMLRTNRHWRVLNTVLALLLIASIIPMWLG